MEKNKFLIIIISSLIIIVLGLFSFIVYDKCFKNENVNNFVENVLDDENVEYEDIDMNSAILSFIDLFNEHIFVVDYYDSEKDTIRFNEDLLNNDIKNFITLNYATIYEKIYMGVCFNRPYVGTLYFVKKDLFNEYHEKLFGEGSGYLSNKVDDFYDDGYEDKLNYDCDDFVLKNLDNEEYAFISDSVEVVFDRMSWPYKISLESIVSSNDKYIANVNLFIIGSSYENNDSNDDIYINRKGEIVFKYEENNLEIESFKIVR